LDILRSKVSDNMNIETSQGDATDLSMFGDGEFDVTLVLGPLYHLFDEAEIRSAIAEAVRVTRPGGTVAFAYLPSDSVCAHEDIIAELMDDRNHFFDDDFNLRRIPDEVFATLRIDELEELLSDYEIEILREVATDGIAPLVKDRINSLTDKQFSVWVEYQMAVCERRELQGYSSHMLCICRRLPADGI
jgi:SAM-dependent methyltransferase